MTTFLNQYTTSGDFPSQWELTPDGFLRVTARILKEGVMPYARHELDEIPPELDGVDPILMLVGMDAMSAGETLRSLEGARVVAPDHEWVEPANAVISKGSAAGAARVEGPYQVVDMVITDQATIDAITSRELGEISGGYHAESVFEPGEWNGQPYHAKQTQLIYNHIAVIRPGEGRAGTDVRIINQKPKEEENQMSMVKIRLANTGKYINVAEEDAPALEEESKAAEAKASEASAGSGKKLEELMAQVEELNGQIAELTASSDEAKGELSVYKEKLDELLSEEAQEASMAAAAEESCDADEIIENAACCMDEKKGEEFKNSFARIGNTGIHKLRGTALQTAVLTGIGMNVENMAPAEIKGAFRAQLHMAVKNKASRVENKAKKVAGAQLFQNQNPQPSDAAARVGKMWGKK